MNRLLTTLVLLLIAGSAIAADDGSGTGIHQFASTLTPAPTDYSVAYLSQIFGTLGNQLTGTSGQIAGHLFSIFNKGVMVVAAIWLGYTTFSVALHAASEGTFMGQNQKLHLVALRICAGFALIIPSPTTGYSSLQDIFMKIVIDGVGLADKTWSNALTYINYGGELYIPPATLNKDDKFVSSDITGVTPKLYAQPYSPNTLSPVTQIFQDEVCMYWSSKWEKIATNYSPQFSMNDDQVIFPGALTGASSSTSVNTACGTVTDVFGGQSQGSINNIIANEKTGGSPPTEAQKQKAQIAFLAMREMVNRMLPAAKMYVDEQTAVPPVTGDTTVYDNIISQTIFSSMLAYANLMIPYQEMLTQTQALKDNTAAQAQADAKNTGKQCIGTEQVCTGSGYNTNCNDESVPVQCHYTAADFESAGTQAAMKHYDSLEFIQEAQAEGWIMAGSFYWSVEQTNQSNSTMSMSALFPSATTLPSAFAYSPEATRNLIDAANKIIVVYSKNISTLWVQYVGAQQQNPLTVGTHYVNKYDGSLESLVTDNASKSLSDATIGLNTSTGYNPIAILMQTGNQLIVAVSHIWLYGILASVGLAAVAGICDSSQPGGLMLEAANTWVKTIFMTLGAAMLGPALILAYYIPMYPFSVYTFASVGWLLIVIEGMAAAPLICMGLTHPEGHDFLGKAEQALMLFLSIFLRPTLMVIGLVLSMIVSFVAFHLLIAAYAQVLASLQAGVGATTAQFGNPSSDNMLVMFISGVMVLVIFGVMTMELIEQCYKLIYQLPNNIMTWIGGQRQGEEYGQMASKVQGAVSGVASPMNEGLKGIQSGAEQAGKAGGKAVKKALDESGSGDISGGGSSPAGGDGGGGGKA